MGSWSVRGDAGGTARGGEATGEYATRLTAERLSRVEGLLYRPAIVLYH